MKRFLISTLISLAASSTAFSMTPQVRTGTLPNGLTYYIMRNQEPKGQADFFLAQRTGSVQEKENERGLAHFLEHMAFNGSEHFPGNSLITYLESIGVKFGADLNAYTSTDETVYNISRVPTVRQSSLDSCLLILRDWSSALCLNDSDIDAERGVIEGEWRHRSAASNRILEKILPQIYPGSIYGKRMPIGLMSVVKNFKPETLRGYYRRWHRPENQAVIVVGDFNPDIMEAKVKQMFSPLKAGNAKGGKAMLPKVPDNKKMIVAIDSDPEQGHNMLQLHFKHKAPELTGEDYWRRKVGESLLGSMLAERMDSLEQTADCPWQSLGVGFTNFLLSRGEHSFVMRGIVKKGREKDAFSAWYAEVLRALDHGFTPEELEMAKTEYMGELTKQRRNKKDSNTAYSRRWVRHFLDGGPLLSIDAELDSLQAVIDGMTPEYCTELLASIADRNGSGRNMVVVGMRPENSQPLTADIFNKALNTVNDMDLKPYSVKAVSGPILEQEPLRGNIVKYDTVANLGCRLYNLSNGVKVYAKKTDYKPGQFYLIGKGPGGLSQNYTPEIAGELKMINDVSPLFCYGDYTQSRLRRRLAGKDLAVKTDIDNTSESVQLSAGPNDREDAFRVLYLKLTAAQPDAANFAIWQGSTAERLAGQGSNPVQVMGDSIHLNVYNRHPLGRKESAAMVRSLNLDTIANVYRDRFSDFSDFTFYATGDFEWKELEELMERYVSSLPAYGRMETPKDIGYRYTPGRKDIDFNMPMETPTAISYSFLSGHADYDIKNYLTALIAGDIIESRLLKDLREDKGWTYSIMGHCSVNPDLNGTDAPSFLWPLYIKTAPEHAQEVKAAVESAYSLMAKEAPSAEEVDKVREYLIKNFREGLTENGFWLSALQKYNDYGLDFANDYVAALNSITPEDVRSFTEKAAKANRTRLTLTPR